ncbi:hypothetical protein [Pedobacter nutrimenti]|uniref:hypothetical protein n=1 Tax=Pedobacter nutrimenti TaxID=1241337 RepID=UPI002930A3C3|nr:hypothetical protein [Pedobacter nutrimenti]
MKKLFFAAALAIVAIGAANATNYYLAGSSTPIACNSGTKTCASFIGGSTVYKFPASNPNGQGAPVDPSEYALEKHL